MSNDNVDFFNTQIRNIANLPGWNVAASSGELSGVSTEFKFGRNPAVGVTEEIIWDGGNGYTFLGAAEKINVVSDDTNDANLGTGAWTVVLFGLDDDFNEINEVVVMDGTTPVLTTKSFRRLFRCLVINSGTPTPFSPNIGTITFTPETTTAAIQAIILPTNGQTLMCVYTVPKNKTAYATGVSFNVGQGKQCLFKVKLRNCATANCAFSVKYIIDLFEAVFNGPLNLPFQVPEKTDIVITGQVSSAPDVTAGASFGLFLVDNERPTP